MFKKNNVANPSASFWTTNISINLKKYKNYTIFWKIYY